jgi:Cutinase
MAHDRPNTNIVLGGYSQGAAVMGFVTSAAVPNGIDPATVPKPMDPEVANHVSSVVLFALPSDKAMNLFGEPPVAIGPLYQAKTIQVCAAEDPICSDGMNFAAHDTYSSNAAMIDESACPMFATATTVVDHHTTTRNAFPTPHRRLDRKPGRPSTASRSISRAGVHAPTGGLTFSSWRAQSSESAAVDEYPGGVSIQPSTSPPRRLRTRAQTNER